MADLGNRTNVNSAIDLLLDDLAPDNSILPSDHNGLLKDILDTLANGLSVTLRTGNTTSGQNLQVTSGDSIQFDNSTFLGSLSSATLTGNQSYLLPDKSGTIALTSEASILAVDSQTLGGNFTHDLNSNTLTLNNGVLNITNGGFGVLGSGNVTSDGIASTLFSFINSSSQPIMIVQNAGNVSIGTSVPDVSAKLEIDSTTQGFLKPRMTTTQRDLIGSPATGLEIFNTTTGQTEFWNGASWGGSGASYGIVASYDSSGNPTFYASLSSAITGASAGDTVVLYGNITETGATEIVLKDGVNINLNGFTYEMSNASTTLDAFTDNNVAVDVTIYNGTIKRSGASGTTAHGLHVDNVSSKIKLQGVEIQSTFGYCIYNQGTIDGGLTSNTAGSYAVWNEGRISNLINSGFSGINQDGSGAGLYDCKSFTTGAVAIYFQNGEGYRCTGESSGGYGLHVRSTDIYDCIGESSSSRGIYCNATSNFTNCTGISTGSDAIYVQTSNSNLKGCKGVSTAGRGIWTNGTGVNLINCVGESSSSQGIYFDAGAGAECSKSTGISTWNNANGHGIQVADADGRVIDCFSKVANISAYGIQANAISPYIAGCKGRGMTTLINSAGNSQTSTPDTYNNILID